METYDIQGVVDAIMEEMQKAQENLKHLNVMVLGKTGVGKSTLINNMFNEPLARTGIGKPITDDIFKYEKAGFPLSIYDTPGLELNGSNSIDCLLKEITKIIESGVNTGDIEQVIHCIWYCVNTASHRFEQAEIDFINKLMSANKKYNVPIILVLTQSFSKKDAKEMKSIIEHENLKFVDIVPVLSSDYDIDDDFTVKAYGLDTLAEVMYGSVPNALKDTMAAVQKVNIEIKQKKAQTIIIASSAAAAAIGATPIPFSDAVLLVPEQIGMLARITVIFGLPVDKATLVSISSAVLGTAGTTFLGKALVTNLLKLIPGAGSIVGGAISGATAASLTAALGEAYIGVMYLISCGKMDISALNTNEGKELLSELFKQKLSIKRDEKGMPLE